SAESGSALIKLAQASPQISVIVTSFNAAETIGECIRSVTSQNYPNIEVILVDAGSTDGTTSQALRVAGSRADFRLIVDESAASHARGRNKGAGAAIGDIFTLTDYDCIAEISLVCIMIETE